ncbi:ATP-dependent helicase HrpB [Ruficoccus amylovorans]|uniref:ATP-dependent helicase HrpB n=1 Tax=Ruficoccus amylovorans TaxID=1804625 RepID=A0A842HDI4_9BACT|nr:ATP-dependent helicase HrpB [Ruficoccus amylovorans]MBC2594573.1 ATP-dependent helicase HrpB [Ruficoccus amylovorans]
MATTRLPIEDLRADLAAALRAGNRVVLSAPTGSGKSTQVPQMLIDEGLVPAGKEVIVLQPRRLAARMLARRVAEERGATLGGEVGFHIRFDRVFGPQTRIKFVTEGILLRMMLTDPELKGVGAIVFDEFHERHLHGDLGIAMIRQLQEKSRPDLLMAVMSATLETGQLSAYLGGCPILKAEGRMFPIEVRYAGAGEASVWERAAQQTAKLVQELPEGDVLIFMPGAYEIRRTVEELQATRGLRECVVLPLHGELPPTEQDAAVARYDTRKIVVATNVAETSLTIDGIRGVVDAGLARVARFDPHRGINTLLIEKISQASAEQRAGRAGRTAPGICLRLWTQKEHEHRPPRELAEIRRVDLAETVLTLKLAGYAELEHFPWFEPPEEKSLARALTLLHDLGALDAAGALTEMGRRMASFPMHPRYARLFLAAQELGCVWHVAVIAALAQGRNLLMPIDNKRRREEREDLLGDTASDFFHLLRAWGMARKQNYNMGFCRQWGIHGGAAREAERGAGQFLRLAQAQGLDTGEGPLDEEAVRRCLLLAFSDQLAKRLDRGTLRCALVHGRKGELRRHSALRDAPLFVAAEIDEIETRGDVTVYLSLATEIDEVWLKEYFPEDFNDSSETFYDPDFKRVECRRLTRFRDLVLASGEGDDPDPDTAARLLAAEIHAGRLPLKSWDNGIERWIARVNFAAAHCPELDIEPLDDEGRLMILEQICHGFVSAKELREVQAHRYVYDWLTQEQRAALETLVPESIELPRRRRAVNIRYEDGRAIISSKLQDFYDTPHKQLTICAGRYPLVVELLAPNGRPAQLTTDLDAFWTTSYEGVKKELRGRYPKHEWR